MLRDLFQLDDGGWLEDAGLLDKLVAAKLRREADTVAVEGWRWIEVATDFPYGHTHGLRKLDGVAADLTPEDRAAIDALNAEYAKLEADYEGADELPDEADARLGEIESALNAFAERPLIYDDAAVARAGAFVSVGASGELAIERGYVRPEDELPDDDGEDRARRPGRLAAGARRAAVAARPAERPRGLCLGDRRHHGA